MTNVIVEYNDFSKDNSNVEKITFDLLPNTELSLCQAEPDANTDAEESETNQLSITMVNKGTEEVEITGNLDEDTLNALIRSLNIFRNQMQDGKNQ